MSQPLCGALTVGELVQVFLKVGASRLGAGAYGHGLAVKVVGRRTRLVDVWPGRLTHKHIT